MPRYNNNNSSSSSSRHTHHHSSASATSNDEIHLTESTHPLLLYAMLFRPLDTSTVMKTSENSELFKISEIYKKIVMNNFKPRGIPNFNPEIVQRKYQSDKARAFRGLAAPTSPRSTARRRQRQNDPFNNSADNSQQQLNMRNSTTSSSFGSNNGTNVNKSLLDDEEAINVDGGDSDDDDQMLLVSSEDISLKDAVSSLYIRVPARLKNCSHIQCCDLLNWVSYAVKSRSSRVIEHAQFKCPNCKSRGTFVDVQIDFFQTTEILKLLEHKTKSKLHLRQNPPLLMWQVFDRLTSSREIPVPEKLRLNADGSIECIEKVRDDHSSDALDVDAMRLSQMSNDADAAMAGFPRVKNEPVELSQKQLHSDQDDNEDDETECASQEESDDDSTAVANNDQENNNDDNGSDTRLEEQRQQRQTSNDELLNQQHHQDPPPTTSVHMNHSSSPSEPLPPLRGRPFCTTCSKYVSASSSGISNSQRNNNAPPPPSGALPSSSSRTITVISSQPQQQAGDSWSGQSSQQAVEDCKILSNDLIVPPSLCRADVITCPRCGRDADASSWPFVWETKLISTDPQNFFNMSLSQQTRQNEITNRFSSHPNNNHNNDIMNTVDDTNDDLLPPKAADFIFEHRPEEETTIITINNRKLRTTMATFLVCWFDFEYFHPASLLEDDIPSYLEVDPEVRQHKQKIESEVGIFVRSKNFASRMDLDYLISVLRTELEKPRKGAWFDIRPLPQRIVLLDRFQKMSVNSSYCASLFHSENNHNNSTSSSQQNHQQSAKSASHNNFFHQQSQRPPISSSQQQQQQQHRQQTQHTQQTQNNNNNMMMMMPPSTLSSTSTSFANSGYSSYQTSARLPAPQHQQQQQQQTQNNRNINNNTNTSSSQNNDTPSMFKATKWRPPIKR